MANNDSLGSFDEIEFVLHRITEDGTKQSDIIKHCQNNNAFFRIPTSGILALLVEIRFIDKQGDTLYLREEGINFINSANKNEYIIVAIFHTLDSNAEYYDFLLRENVEYDTYLQKYTINKSAISLKYSGLRNLLLKLGYFQEDNTNKSILLIDDDLFKPTHELISKIVRKKTIENLKDDLKRKEENGIIAEEFVIKYEQKRITKKVESIKRISDIDTTAGFDILSYNNDSSLIHDRFIEVKSYIKSPYFFLTRNEFETAKRYKNRYYLYLVDRSKIDIPDYHPIIIPDPYSSILSEPKDWKKSCVQWQFIK